MLTQLLNDDNQTIAWAARKVQDLDTQLQKNEISAAEYRELLEDLVRDDQIAALSNQLESKILLEKVLSIMLAAAGAI